MRLRAHSLSLIINVIFRGLATMWFFTIYKIVIAICLLSTLYFPSFSYAEIIYATHKYVLGDNDSKNDARKMCFLEAKQKVIEKAGTYIESLTEVKNARLSKDEILAYSSALLKVETLKEDWKMSGDNMAVILKVKADVDTGNLKNKFSKIRKDKSIQKEVIEQQKKLRHLEKEVVQLQQKLGAVDSNKAASLRKDRNLVFKEIDELESKSIAVLSKVHKITKNAIQYIDKGMTKHEVESILGKPRSILFYFNDARYNYGKVWLIFPGDILQCIVNGQCFESRYSCNHYRVVYSECLIQ
jgi:hypothetical protein